ncbi:triose-phosphate isomerase [Mucilaginibacter sp. HMF5004]|uniref:triose-phosphate isomerase n=1 Tax=Mucilaginibacter rivuli TaxID=2857527 RepID=UPI001C5FE97E|nr:triose-phosphate isomerase [Mucilaginibacter rivuli]MBW4889774.1 triose-phosphate isomerase [Mucilaginibacter rivuli]
MRTKIVAGNWKMNLDYFEGLNLFNEIVTLIKQEVTGKQEAIICSPYIHLHALANLVIDTEKVSVGAQNAHHAEAGAFTGEISAKMIHSVGAEYVILGHSERRQYFAEDGALLTKKVDIALAHHLTPIYCIGETLKERESHKHFDVIKKQLVESVFHLSAADFSKLILAYEPVWAIGTGVTASADQAQEIHAFIRKEIAAKYGKAVADGITILYGGSCNPKNAHELFAKHDIDGGLIGGASLKARDFVDILKAFN